MKKVRTLFIGSGEFAIPILNELLKNESVALVGVVTQPDKPVGRKQKLTPSPLGEVLLKNKISVSIEQPEKIGETSSEILEKYKPELIIVASYGQIIPKAILEYPRLGCFNVHGSILPRLRGAVPVHMAILTGLKKTGVTLQRMVEAMDAGNILAVKETDVTGGDTTETLMARLSFLGASLVNESLPRIIAGNLSETKQDENEATYCYKDDISKSKAEITFDSDIELAERMVRAFYPWPVAWVKLEGKILKVFRARIERLEEGNLSGPLITREGSKLLLHLRNGVLELLEIGLEAKRRDLAKNYFFLAKPTSLN